MFLAFRNETFTFENESEPKTIEVGKLPKFGPFLLLSVIFPLLQFALLPYPRRRLYTMCLLFLTITLRNPDTVQLRYRKKHAEEIFYEKLKWNLQSLALHSRENHYIFQYLPDQNKFVKKTEIFCTQSHHIF